MKRVLKRCEAKGAEVAILYFPKGDNYSLYRLMNGIAKFNGISDYRFKQIVAIQGDHIYKKSHL